MLDDLLLHPRTRKQLENFIASPVHGLMLTGPEGAGKRTVAIALSSQILHLSSKESLTSYPYYSLTDPSEATISIDEIRRLQKLLTLKTPSKDNQAIRRVLTIVDAGRMRFEAQNAFLKSLEEPPADTVIILTTGDSNAVLPTIYSRVQHIDILPVSEAMAKEYFTQQGIPASQLARQYALSQGQVGLLSALLRDEEHALKQSVEQAKALLKQTPGERLLITEQLAKDKEVVTMLIDACGRIAHAGLLSASKAGNKSAVKRWRECLEAVQSARNALRYNANTKLLVDQLLLSL